MRHRNRVSSRRPQRAVSAEVQALEARTLPAGTVTASYSGGSITLNGDRFNNVIEIEFDSTGLFVRGLDGTNIKFGARTITDGSPFKLAPGPTVTRDLVVNLKDGNDVVELFVDGVDASIGRNLKIDTGRGEDIAGVLVPNGSLTVGNELNIKLGDASDYLLLNGDAFFEDELPDDHEEEENAPLHVNGLTKVSAGTGDDIVGIANFSTDGNLEIETGHGDDTVGVEFAFVGGNATISTGGDDDDVGIAFVQIEGRGNITTGSGNDRVGVFNTHSQGNVSIRLEQGNDLLAAAGELTVGEDAQVLLSGGNGVDEIDTLAADGEFNLAVDAIVIGFESGDSPELAFDILDEVFDLIFDDFDV